MTAYIHIPFCETKCRYCVFTSFAAANKSVRETYVSTLKQELEQFARANDVSAPIETIFLGGGTPTILTTDDLCGILDTFRKLFHTASDAEITIECNPNTAIDFGKLVDCGFNRFSIGVQSLIDEELLTLGRTHNVRTAITTIENANKCCNNISIDLIYAIPGQTADTLNRTLLAAMELGVKHISAYSLTYEEGSVLTKMRSNNRLISIDEEKEYDMYLRINEVLHSGGIEQYEVSNYAIPGYESRHNMNYWRCGEYLGFGLAAHSHICNVRFANVDNLNDYVLAVQDGHKPLKFSEKLTEEERREEYFMLAFRSYGVEKKLLNTKQLRLADDCISDGLLVDTGIILQPTMFGRYLADELALSFLKF
jgi:oxygen-independent coproporphyrinogen-3 oxidase